MSVIPRTYNNGDLLTPALMNAAGNALAGMQITDDNAGFPILGNSFIPGLSLLLGAAHEVAQAFAGVGTFTVPAGKWLYITNYTRSTAGTDTITPSGAAAFTIGSIASATTLKIGLLLGPGDAITLGNAANFVSGTLFDAPSGVSRILQTVSNTVTYSVPALRRLLLCEVICGSTTALLQIGGVNAIYGALFDVAGATISHAVGPVGVGAGQTLGSANATLVLINGILYTTAT